MYLFVVLTLYIHSKLQIHDLLKRTNASSSSPIRLTAAANLITQRSVNAQPIVVTAITPNQTLASMQDQSKRTIRPNNQSLTILRQQVTIANTANTVKQALIRSPRMILKQSIGPQGVNPPKQVQQRLEVAALMSTSPANIGHRLVTTTITSTPNQYVRTVLSNSQVTLL